MRITEIAPPGREKQVKALKKKFDDKGAPYAIAWAQHNKHGKPKKNEGKMSDIDIDIKTMSDTEFEKKYGKSKEQLQKDLNEAFNSERDEVKAILDKYGIKNADDIEYGSDVYMELYSYFADSGEMPYGVMKARDGDPDQWIADRLDDLDLVEIADVPTQKGRDAKPNVLTPRAMNVVKKQIKKDANKQRRADSKKAVDVEEGPSDMGMNKYGLSATKFGDKFKSYQHGKLTGEFNSMEELQKHQLELIQDKPVDEAPFGQAVKGALGRAVKRAGTNVKKAVGNVPGLGDLKTAAQGEQNIMKVADQTWKDFIQYKQSNPTDDQIQGWFKQRGMEVKDGNVDKNTVIQGVKQAIARDQGGPAKPNDPNASQAPNQDSEIEKVKTANLQKLAPEIKDIPMAKRGIEKLAGGKMASKKEIEAMLPLIKGIANTLSNTGKSSIVGKQMQKESLSQTDLSKLDMLARQGMVPKNKVARFKTAMRTLSKGKDLPISYKDDVIDVVLKLSKIITKPSVMGMIRKGLRENQDPKNTFDKWVNKAKKEYDI